MDASDSFVTFFVGFPGLYLTYGKRGELLLTETPTERGATVKPLAKPGQQLQLSGEMGSDTLGMVKAEVPEDDDVPF